MRAHIAAGDRSKGIMHFEALARLNPLVVWPFNRLMSAYTRTKDQNAVLGVLDLIQSRGLQPDTETYTTLCYFFHAREQYELAHQYIKDYVSRGGRLTHTMYEMQAMWANVSGNHEQALDYLRLVQPMGSNHRPSATVIAVEALAGLNDRYLAWRTFSLLRTTSIYGSRVSAALAKMHGPLHSAGDIKSVFAAIRNLDVDRKIALVHLIHGYSAIDDPASGMVLLDYLHRAAYPLHPHVHEKVLIAHARRGDFSEVMSFLSMLQFRDIPLSREAMHLVLVNAYRKDPKAVDLISDYIRDTMPGESVKDMLARAGGRSTALSIFATLASLSTS
ncbi:hypothetical protein BASA62_003843 [Batrachochytrium salamandrivorans]|nr:hypothetical protein BASA62_003843 [Batrachochytrium salamandrivorans]